MDPQDAKINISQLLKAGQQAESLLKEVLIEMNEPFEEALGEAAFYGPKIDIQLANIYGKRRIRFHCAIRLHQQ